MKNEFSKCPITIRSFIVEFLIPIMMIGFLFSVYLKADPICQDTINAASTNITGTWTLSAKLINMRNVQGIAAVNSSGKEILINCSGGSSSAPSSTAKNSIPVGGSAGDTTWVLDGYGGGSACWYKSNTTTVTSGIFKLCVNGQPGN